MARLAPGKVRMVALAYAFVGLAIPVFAQPGIGGEIAWPPTSDALEACIESEEKGHATGHACIGKAARHCLEIAQREPIVHVEKCYAPELAAWARLVTRYFGERPKNRSGERIAEVQRAWLTYRTLRCEYVAFHHGGPDHGQWQRLMCLLEETGRRAIELRSFRGAR